MQTDKKINKTDIRLLSKAQLEEALVELGEKKFRAQQIYEWLWKKNAASFHEMFNLSKPLRLLLEQNFTIYKLVIDVTQKSSDGTIKVRFVLHDGFFVEGVLIPVVNEKRMTACISSQVGCSLTCSFCATGKMKRMRNLEVYEMYDQVHLINQIAISNYNAGLTNIVYMGMGEPLLNYKNVMKSIEMLQSEEGLHFSHKRITLSTAGIAKMIQKLADDGAKISLALSLHAADDEKRNKIMPINEQNNLESLMESLRYFKHKTGNNITFEYICFAGFNDTLNDAKKILQLAKPLNIKVNIIEYNPIDNFEMQKSKEHDIDNFAKFLVKNGVRCTIRKSRGKDIDAACGQLANKN